MNPQDESRFLLTDGYIAWSFQSQPATQYFCKVLRTNAVPPLKALSFPGRESVFLAVDCAVAPQIPPHIFDETGRHFWVLDRKISSGGPVVPQMMPAPLAVSDVSLRGRTDLPDLQFPIFFENVDGKLGIPLEAAAAGRCGTLRNAQEYAQLGAWSTTHICIAWLGYEWFTRLVRVRDDTHAHRDVRITVATFAHRIGESVNSSPNFIQECRPDPRYTSSGGQLWRIGDGGAQGNNIMIIGAINPSAGSWMPILQFIRHPSAEYDTIADVNNRRINWEAITGLGL